MSKQTESSGIRDDKKDLAFVSPESQKEECDTEKYLKK